MNFCWYGLSICRLSIWLWTHGSLFSEFDPACGTHAAPGTFLPLSLPFSDTRRSVLGMPGVDSILRPSTFQIQSKYKISASCVQTLCRKNKKGYVEDGVAVGHGCLPAVRYTHLLPFKRSRHVVKLSNFLLILMSGVKTPVFIFR